MSQTCTESIFYETDCLLDFHEWTVQLAVVGHFNIVSDQTIDLLRIKARDDFELADVVALAEALFSQHASQHSKLLDVWQTLYDHCQNDSYAINFLGNFERKLALSVTSSAIPFARTLKIQFTPQFTTITKFHKTFLVNSLFSPTFDAV